MAPVSIPKKYLDSFVKEFLVQGKRFHPGTMPADVRAIRAAIKAKLGDKQFVQGLVNEVVRSRSVEITLK